MVEEVEHSGAIGNNTKQRICNVPQENRVGEILLFPDPGRSGGNAGKDVLNHMKGQGWLIVGVMSRRLFSFPMYLERFALQFFEHKQGQTTCHKIKNNIYDSFCLPQGKELLLLQLKN